MKFLRKLKKPTKRQVEKFLLNSLIIVVGNMLASGAASFFIVPNGFVMGGTTGLGIFVRNLMERYSSVDENITRWAVNITVYVANIALYIIGVIILGKKFALATGAGTFLYPTFMSIFDLLNDMYYKAHGSYIALSDGLGSPLLAMICGSLLFGLGIGMVLRVGASTGGTDIPPLIFKKLFNAPMSVTMYLLDFSIVALQLVAAPLDAVIYGVLITLISTIVIDKVSPVGMKRTQVTIISEKYREIRDMILTKVSRGVTVLYGQTGYLKKQCRVILTVISQRQLVTLKAEVQKIDPNAFMTIGIVSEVHGRGFHLDGVDFLMPQERDDIGLKPVQEEEAEAPSLPPETPSEKQ